MKVLIDTNILFHAMDSRDQRKHGIARKIVENAFTHGAFVSAQNLGELFNTAKRKFTSEQCENVALVIKSIITSEKWVKVAYDQRTILKVVSNDREQFDFWDSVIYFTMLENGITAIMTENEKDFKHFGGIEVINPFKP